MYILIYMITSAEVAVLVDLVLSHHRQPAPHLLDHLLSVYYLRILIHLVIYDSR